eukprot:1654658-Prymnesium_polylepis.1
MFCGVSVAIRRPAGTSAVDRVARAPRGAPSDRLEIGTGPHFPKSFQKYSMVESKKISQNLRCGQGVQEVSLLRGRIIRRAPSRYRRPPRLPLASAAVILQLKCD